MNLARAALPGPAVAAAPDEPLSLSAPMARAWSARCCVADADGQTCAHYHGLWQYLRLMGLGPTLGGHPQAYLQAMADLAAQWTRDPRPIARRVLVAGCADYSMLAHVLQALDAPGRNLHVTVVDLCPTALQLNSWYAQHIGRAVEVECVDLLNHAPEDGYDLVITSSLLGFIEPRHRPGLFAMFARNLRCGGSVVLSNRLRGAPQDQRVPVRPGDAERFADQVAASAEHLPQSLALTRQDAWRMAIAYATLRRPYPVNGLANIERLAAGAGLVCPQPLPLRSEALRPGIQGPTLADGSPYVMVTLTRPAA